MIYLSTIVYFETDGSDHTFYTDSYSIGFDGMCLIEICMSNAITITKSVCFVTSIFQACRLATAHLVIGAGYQLGPWIGIKLFDEIQMSYLPKTT